MKKLVLVILFFSFAISVFSQDLIGRRLRYEVRSSYIYITDIIDDRNLIIYPWFIADTFYRLRNERNSAIIMTDDIYSPEFPTKLAQYITSWSSSNGGDRVWQQNALLIATMITQLLQEWTPPLHGQAVPPPPDDSLFISQLQPGMYYVQIGSFTNIAMAHSEIDKIDRSLPVAIMQATVRINGITTNVNRVLIGPLNQTDSVSVLQRYRLNYNDAFVWTGR